jgi:tetratricopeptide (TPR) repeat protein
MPGQRMLALMNVVSQLSGPRTARRFLTRSALGGARRQCGIAAIAAVWLLTAPSLGAAQPAPTRPAGDAPAQVGAAVQNSALDAQLFYQLLAAELEWRQGRAAVAFEVVLEAARRTKHPELFQRAVDMALQARAADRALTAARAWRSAHPEAVEPVRLQLQILAALNRPAEASEPLRSLLARTPGSDRAGLIASVPRLFQRSTEARAVATMLETALQPQTADASMRVPAWTALGRAWLQAGDMARALDLARRAHTAEPQAPGPALLALELMPRAPAAESIVRSHLDATPPQAPILLAYARTLTQMNRHDEALVRLQAATASQPDNAPAWLLLGALHLELKQAGPAEQALQRYLRLADAAPRSAPAQGGADDDEDEATPAADAGTAQAWLMLAQAAELRQDYAAAEAYLQRIDNPQRLLEVQTRRATMVARQGRVDEARELIRKVPELDEDDARSKLVAEAQLLRDLKRHGEAYEVYGRAAVRWPRDLELLYEQAMVAEKLNLLPEMEQLLRRVIELKPDHAHAHNALGYSLADRGLRLQEARGLIVRALELMPGDPFITDSLGWVEFRLGNHAEALRLLQQAYAARPDAEIAAHLGEVLWTLGRRDEALRVWRDGRQRDAGNEVLRETVARLRAEL